MKKLFTIFGMLLFSQVMMAQATWFGKNYKHMDSPANCSSYVTALDTTQIGGNNPSDRLIFNHIYDNSNHNHYMRNTCGLAYDGPAWVILDETGVDMDTLLAFNVLNPTTNGTVFTHTVTVANSYANSSDIDDTLLNGHPEAVFFISKTKDNGVYDTAHVGIWYDESNTKWSVYNEAGGILALNSTYNIFVPDASTSFFKHTVTDSSYITFLDNSLLNGNPDARIFVVHDYTDSSATQHYVDDEIGVWYAAPHWSIYSENITPLLPGTTFNVLVVANTDPAAGIAENKSTENKLILTPNPANDKINVLLDDGANSSSINSIMITGIDGRTVLQKSFNGNASKQTVLNVSALSQGLYILNVKTNERVMSSKLSIVR